MTRWNYLEYTIKDWCNECYFKSSEAGWWQDGAGPYVIATKLALIHSEISEAMEGFRKNTQDAHLPHRPTSEVELADACIRIFDLAGACKLDLEGAIIEKMKYNRDRADHKLENRAKEGGKKF